MAEIKITQPISKKETGVLAGLWRNILRDNNYLPALDYLVNRYVARTDKMEGRVLNMKRKTKSSIIKNITDPEMSFKTFIDLLFNFLSVKRIDISIKLTFPNGNETLHNIAVDNSSIEGDNVEKQNNNSDKKHS